MVREVHLISIVEWGQNLEAKELVGADHLNIKLSSASRKVIISSHAREDTTST